MTNDVEYDFVSFLSSLCLLLWPIYSNLLPIFSFSGLLVFAVGLRQSYYKYFSIHMLESVSSQSAAHLLTSLPIFQEDSICKVPVFNIVSSLSSLLTPFGHFPAPLSLHLQAYRILSLCAKVFT